MNIESFREYCLLKREVTEELPFGPDTLVYKVMGKLFALCGVANIPGSCNLKCDPERAQELREKYPSIIPGYHMNKKHWNTIVWDGSISDKLIEELIDHSYNLVVAGIPVRQRNQLNKELPPKKFKQESNKNERRQRE